MATNPLGSPVGELVIKRRVSATTKLLIAGAVAVVVVIGGSALYSQGLRNAGFHLFSRGEQAFATEQHRDKLLEENRQLRESLVRAERALQMNQVAYEELTRALKSSERDLALVREDLGFYRSIFTPSGNRAGLRIQNLRFQREEKDGWQYRLVMVQGLAHDRRITGRVQIEITGVQGGRQVTQTVPGDREPPIMMQFKYFQDFAGRFRLPAGFQPARVRVVAHPQGQGAVEAIYAWSSVEKPV